MAKSMFCMSANVRNSAALRSPGPQQKDPSVRAKGHAAMSGPPSEAGEAQAVAAVAVAQPLLDGDGGVGTCNRIPHTDPLRP